MLTFENVALTQGAFTLSVEDDALPFGRVCVVGPSGCGKSTLLSAIAGFVPVGQGRILWEGRDISGVDPAARPVSMVFQDNNLFPHLSIAQNVALAVEPRLAISAATQRRVDDVLARVGLDGFGARKPAALSGGQQSRAALARVLLADRPVVLLDEPFAALGPGLRHEMLELVKDVLKGKLVMMVTHDPSDAQRFGGSTILIDAGHAARAQDTAAMFADPPEVLKTYLGQ